MIFLFGNITLTCIYIVGGPVNEKSWFGQLLLLKKIIIKNPYVVVILLFFFIFLSCLIRSPVYYTYVGVNIPKFPALVFTLFSTWPLLVYIVNVFTQIITSKDHNFSLNYCFNRSINSKGASFSIMFYAFTVLGEIFILDIFNAYILNFMHENFQKICLFKNNIFEYLTKIKFILLNYIYESKLIRNIVLFCEHSLQEREIKFRGPKPLRSSMIDFTLGVPPLLYHVIEREKMIDFLEIDIKTEKYIFTDVPYTVDRLMGLGYRYLPNSRVLQWRPGQIPFLGFIHRDFLILEGVIGREKTFQVLEDGEKIYDVKIPENLPDSYIDAFVYARVLESMPTVSINNLTNSYHNDSRILSLLKLVVDSRNRDQGIYVKNFFNAIYEKYFAPYGYVIKHNYDYYDYKPDFLIYHHTQSNGYNISAHTLGAVSPDDSELFQKKMKLIVDSRNMSVVNNGNNSFAVLIRGSKIFFFLYQKDFHSE